MDMAGGSVKLANCQSKVWQAPSYPYSKCEEPAIPMLTRQCQIAYYQENGHPLKPAPAKDQPTNPPSKARFMSVRPTIRMSAPTLLLATRPSKGLKRLTRSVPCV